MKSKRVNCETCGHRVPREQHAKHEWTQCVGCTRAKVEHAAPEPTWDMLFNFKPVKVWA